MTPTASAAVCPSVPRGMWPSVATNHKERTPHKAHSTSTLPMMRTKSHTHPRLRCRDAIAPHEGVESVRRCAASASPMASISLLWLPKYLAAALPSPVPSCRFQANVHLLLGLPFLKVCTPAYTVSATQPRLWNPNSVPIMVWLPCNAIPHTTACVMAQKANNAIRHPNAGNKVAM